MSPTSMPRQQQEPGSGRRGHEAQTTPSPRESSLAPARLSFPVLCWLEQPQASPDARGGDGGRAVPPTLQAGFQKHIRMKENSPPLRGCWHGLTSPLQHLGPREPRTLCLEHSLVHSGRGYHFIASISQGRPSACQHTQLPSGRSRLRASLGLCS